ncbi:MAG: D-alanyl-D-alanine carboxypeptidase (penicillin-binding protein 5/6) [Glaciecola sp.]|jgi:D-alanyl-D-alanine carboxypeptidase (penicillin-binding protein 5/6)|uniref:D-alanyl-D-alanine carboxypeptidase family protein n=1 Tax=Congregibacter sp. TaxID=2744308 RepID=UPI0039E320D9
MPRLRVLDLMLMPHSFRSIFATTSCLVLSLAAFSASVSAQNIVPAAPEVAAKAYLLVDARSGAVLVESNADEQLPPASLTKLMTAYVLASEIDAGRVSREDQVTVSRNAWSQNPVFNGSSLMWIEPRMPVNIGQLEQGIVISSGNDATVAVAEHIAGSETAFADLMNKHAAELGMHGSYFANSHGLPHPQHMMTARDLATLAKAIITRFPEHYKVYSQREYTYNDISQYNRNKLLGEDPSVDGLKTGYTREAGYGLVASAERNGMRLISVVMGTDSTRARARETRSLLNYGFRFFETDVVVTGAEELEKPRVWKGQTDYVAVGIADDVVLTLPRGKRNSVVTELVLMDPISAPLAQGDTVGELTLSLDGEVLQQVPLVALEPIEQGGFFARVWDMILMWLAQLFGG